MTGRGIVDAHIVVRQVRIEKEDVLGLEVEIEIPNPLRGSVAAAEIEIPSAIAVETERGIVKGKRS